MTSPLTNSPIGPVQYPTIQEKSEDCVYIARKQYSNADCFFCDLIERSLNKNETFESIRAYFEQNIEACHQFKFKYLIGDNRTAQDFIKALHIKTQKAHRFVPPIEKSKFIAPSHLGFNRQITIRNNGPTIQEHILVDENSPTALFVEERGEEINGSKFEGSFAAINSVIEENGRWYFTGTYLSPDEPNKDQIVERKKMYDATFNNMMDFIKNSDVNSVYNWLKAY